MKLYLFRNIPYIESKDIGKLLQRYKTTDNEVYIYSTISYGIEENVVEAIVKSIKESQLFIDKEVMDFWMFNKLSKEPFWKEDTKTVYSFKRHKKVPIKYLINGVLCLDNAEKKQDQITKFTIEIVD